MNEVTPAPWYTSRTLITQLVVGVLIILKLSGVVPPDEDAVGKIIDLVLAVGAIYVTYLRLEPSPPKPITQAQSTALTVAAMRIVGPKR